MYALAQGSDNILGSDLELSMTFSALQVVENGDNVTTISDIHKA